MTQFVCESIDLSEFICEYPNMEHLLALHQNKCAIAYNILWAALAPKSFCQKITNPNCKYIKAACKILVILTSVAYVLKLFTAVSYDYS